MTFLTDQLDEKNREMLVLQQELQNAQGQVGRLATKEQLHTKQYSQKAQELSEAHILFTNAEKQVHLAIEAKNSMSEENEMVKQWNQELKAKLEEAMKNNLQELQRRKTESPEKSDVSLLSENEINYEEEALQL